MNLRALIVCGASAVALAAEITGASRGWLVILLAASVLLALVPFLSGFIEFLSSPRSKWRRFKYSFFDLVLDEYFSVWESSRRLKGKGIYCHQGYRTTVNCVHDDHLVLETPREGSGSDGLCFSRFPGYRAKSTSFDIVNEPVSNLSIRYKKDASNDSVLNAFPVADRDRLKSLGLTVVREPVSCGDYFTCLVDLYPADPAWDVIFEEPHQSPVHMELAEINVGDLNVCFTFAPKPIYRKGVAVIKFKIKGNPEYEEIKREWGYREARRFMSYLAYWEKRRCCGVLLTVPFCKIRSSSKITVVLNVCTVQDLIVIAESQAPLSSVSITSEKPFSHQCITEGEDFWKWEKNASTLTKAAEKEKAFGERKQNV